MLYVKKKRQQVGDKEEDAALDFAWITYIGINKLGYTEKDIEKMRIGKWLDLYDAYKAVFNFEQSGRKYTVAQERKPVSLLSF